MLEDREYMRGNSYQTGMSATVILLIVNLVIFIIQSLAERYTAFPVEEYFYLSLEGLKKGFLWQIITFQFLHAGIWHLIFNSIGIWFMGKPVEETLGKRRFWMLYFICGIAGGLLQMIFAAGFPMAFGGRVLGASAGALGLVAAFATLFPDRILTLLLFFVIPINLRAKVLLWISIGIALFGIVFPGDGIAHAAHLGGIIGGVLFIRRLTEDSTWSWRQFFPRKTRSGGPRPPVSAMRRRQETEAGPEDFIKREVDPILDKISAHGIHSLTEKEREILDRARKQMGQR